MPELPEVETTKRGIEPFLKNATVSNIIVRNPNLRWKVDPELAVILKNQKVKGICRRAKYLLLAFDKGTLILHLGMSGSLRVVTKNIAVEKHDHIDICLDNEKIIRFRDPRRFGSVLWTEGAIENHRLLNRLGPEPLEENFHGDYLFASTRGRKRAIKQHIMDNHIVVGVGNIYASESLFKAGIHPGASCNQLSKQSLVRLSNEIKNILQAAIEQGGTTLKDFSNVEGQPGYFAQKLYVYGRKNEPCLICTTKIEQITQGQRSSYFCAKCQKSR